MSKDGDGELDGVREEVLPDVGDELNRVPKDIVVTNDRTQQEPSAPETWLRDYI